MKLRLGKYRHPQRNPYKIPAHARAWRLGVKAKFYGVIVAGNPYSRMNWPRRVGGKWTFPKTNFLEWAAWRRGWLEAGGYCPFLRARRKKK